MPGGPGCRAPRSPAWGSGAELPPRAEVPAGWLKAQAGARGARPARHLCVSPCGSGCSCCRGGLATRPPLAARGSPRERACARRWIWRRRCWTCGGPARRRRRTGRAPRGETRCCLLACACLVTTRADTGAAWRAVCVCADAAVGPVAGRARVALERLWPHGELGGRHRYAAGCGWPRPACNSYLPTCRARAA